MSDAAGSAPEELLAGGRIGRFVSVGAVGAGFDTATTLTLQSAGVYPGLAKLVGAEVAIAVMFLINEHWTFANIGTAGVVPTLRRFLRSNLVRVGGLAVQLVVFEVVRRLPVSVPFLGIEWWTVLPILIAIGTAVAVNYVAESLFTWRVQDRA
jgi:putative flippase GtrA